jgi:hypothetical protein
MHIRTVAGDTPNTVNTSVVRTRRYLTNREVETDQRLRRCEQD